MSEHNLGLIIRNLTIDEIKEVLKLVREIEQRNPEKVYFVQVVGLEKKPAKEVIKIMQEVFPEKPVKKGWEIPVG